MQQTIDKAINSPSPAPEAVAAMRRRYPFFTLPMAMELAATADEDERRRLLMLMRLSAPTPEAMEQLAGCADSRFNAFYPPAMKPHTPDTSTAIDDFLARYSSSSPEEDALLERMIFNPVPDYAQQLARRTEAELPDAPPPSADSQDARISRFILAHADSAPQPESPAPPTQPETSAPQPSRRPARRTRQASPQPAENSLLSESLAKIYIKSHKYERAFEILSRLSLDFPEKSRYFADQLRFLRKLIINEQHRNRQNTPGDTGQQSPKL